MVSTKQLKANRRNAKRSTGPKTQSGQARASRNSLTHGLTSQKIVIGDEDPSRFEELRRGLEKDLKPLTTIETEIVERLAVLFWRLRRIPWLEAAVIEARLLEVGSRDLMSFLSPEAREVVEGVEEIARVDREASARLEKQYLAEIGNEVPVDPASSFGPSNPEERRAAKL
jgi:hypothetical protein